MHISKYGIFDCVNEFYNKLIMNSNTVIIFKLMKSFSNFEGKKTQLFYDDCNDM